MQEYSFWGGVSTIIATQTLIERCELIFPQEREKTSPPIQMSSLSVELVENITSGKQELGSAGPPGESSSRGEREGLLFCLNRVFGAKPLPPATLKGINFSVSFVDYLLCHPGTGVFAGSGTVENKCTVFRIFFYYRKI